MGELKMRKVIGFTMAVAAITMFFFPQYFVHVLIGIACTGIVCFGVYVVLAR